ncbi:response regulator transcription factor [Shimazuella sp. AN120528]|uniref:response regulator transcription factor n=1 Tax=Shimazuella soli TaxID=1892854 RepID=UPI001F0D6772|nr:response regulator transcription factor [Shimazuella soli]MCH5583502.1 response regulator transcription factor [Shimazuella soli]
MENKVLVADDEKSMRDILSYALRREGYVVELAQDGEEALQKMKQFQPQVAILDVMMPKMSGYDICRKIESEQHIGVILLTAKNDIVDKVLGMELGADDYITKPFDIREVLVRVKSLFRRLAKHQKPANESEEYTLHDLLINQRGRKVVVNGASIPLTLKEFDLLFLLISHLERVFTREELLNLVWGMEYLGGTRTVDIHIRRLRQKLGSPYDHLLKTVHGVGYKCTNISGDNRS